MKRFYNYTFQLVCIYILVLAVFSIFSFDLTKTNYEKKVHNENEEKVLDSTLLVKSLEKDEGVEEESIKENEQVVEEQKQEPIEEVHEEVKEESKPGLGNNIKDLTSYPVLSSEVVTISRYGPDCAGCEGGQTAAGYYVGDGRIYYEDATYGSLRVVAADKKYPLGTVFKITHNGNSFGAIVLDRGGGIGDHARFQIDLLEPSEREANASYIMYNASLEVLRYGY